MMSRYSRIRSSPLLALAVLALVGCEDGLSVSDTANVRILLTDAPSDYISEARVDIGTVELLSSDGGERVVLSEDGTDGPVNLLDL